LQGSEQINAQAGRGGVSGYRTRVADLQILIQYINWLDDDREQDTISRSVHGKSAGWSW